MVKPICPIHQIEFRLVPAGTSKKPPYRPYEAFYSCPEFNCTTKPISVGKAEVLSDMQSDQASINESAPTNAPVSPEKPKEVPQSVWDEKTRRIERQHSQSMAIEFLRLHNDLQPAETFEMPIDKLYEKVIEYTDKFQEDLEKKK